MCLLNISNRQKQRDSQTQVRSIFVGLGSETGDCVEVSSFIASGVSLAIKNFLGGNKAFDA